MEDIAPKLYEEIDRKFTTDVRADSRLKNIAIKVGKKRATQKDMEVLSSRLGIHASDAFRAVLKTERLPDGKLYWNIAGRTIRPIMQTIYDSINTLAAGRLRGADIARHMNIGVITGVDPKAHIETLMGLATTADTPEALDVVLDKGVKTTALDYLDDFNEANAKARDGLGIKQYVVREYDGVGLNNGKEPCQWCLQREGTWSYDDALSNGVFERHEGCGCTIEVVPADEMPDDVGDLPDIPF